MFEQRFGVRLVQGFGMTEINMVAYSDPADPVIPGCAGRVLEEFFEVIVADPDTDEPLPADRVGEILVRPRQPFRFNVGYFQMPDKTVEAVANLWFHTGDAGRFDPQGRLHFVDRLKDRIRRRGETSRPTRSSRSSTTTPPCWRAWWLGVRVEGAGGEEEIKAVLVLEPGASIDPAELTAYCVANGCRASPAPRDVEVVDARTRPRRARCASRRCAARASPPPPGIGRRPGSICAGAEPRRPAAACRRGRAHGQFDTVKVGRSPSPRREGAAAGSRSAAQLLHRHLRVQPRVACSRLSVVARASNSARYCSRLNSSSSSCIRNSTGQVMAFAAASMVGT